LRLILHVILLEKEGINWTEQTSELLDDNSIRAVVICTPTTSHASLIKEAIKRKKDVFCEKPLAASLEEIIKLRNIANKSESLVLIGYVYRFVPIFEEGFKLFRKRQINGESIVMGKPLSRFFSFRESWFTPVMETSKGVWRRGYQ